MKKLVGLILASALLWSCGSQFSKSKYDRHMWNRSHGKSEKETVLKGESNTENVNKYAAPSKNGSISMISNENNSEIGIRKNNTSNSKIEIKEKNSAVTSSIVNKNNSFEKRTIESKLEVKKKNIKSLKWSNDLTPTQGGGDANLILLVILAIILPPLGVYLKDGSITGLFWLTLIFCLIGGGGIFGLGFIFGGLWGVAAILALLRVFDII